MPINWKQLNHPEHLNEISSLSAEVPCLIFKHSTRCSISTIAKHRLENNWHFSDQDIQAYYLDLLAFRAISNEVAERFSVSHESPQVLLIHEGECIYDASHLDIKVDELHDCLRQLNV